MTLHLMGKKRGMTQLFDSKGAKVVCTVIEVEPNVITQVKSKEKDGYNAVQCSFEKVRKDSPKLKKPLKGHFEKAGVDPRRYLAETRLEDVSAYELGSEFGVGIFSDVAFVDVSAQSIGKGYQGVMKKYGFAGGPGAHGSKFHRRAGSTGMRSTPGRCLPGGPRASQMGNKKVTVQGLKVFLVDEARSLLVLQGAVPGSKGSLVTISKAIKKHN